MGVPDTLRVRVLAEDTLGSRGDLVAEPGLSLLLQTPQCRVMLDCGASGAFRRNARLLGERLDDVCAAVLSHGHYDHGGGLPDLLEAAPTARIALHPAALAPHYARRKGGRVDAIGLPEPGLLALRAAPQRCLWALRPVEVAPSVWASGPVPRRHPLEGPQSHFFLDEACTLRDDVAEDQALWVETPSGLVVLLGCAHSGVVNTVSYVREAVASRAGEPSCSPRAADGLPVVRAVLGGMHLLGAGENRLRETVEYLAALDLEYCAPCHCTGQRAIALLRERLGPQILINFCGGSELRF